MEFRKVKLPRLTKKHPLLEGLDFAVKRDGCSMRHIARSHFKMTQQALHHWRLKAKADRDYNVPVRQVIPLCRLTGQPPYLYNPELWPNREWTV